MTKVRTTTAVRSARVLAALLGSTALTTAFVVVALADESKPVQTAQAEQAPAAPAEGDAAKKDKVERVTVTARRRKEDVLDVPYNITAVQGSDIEAQKVQDAPELLRSIPGVSVVDRGYRNNSAVDGVRIRGLNTDSSALGDYAVAAPNAVSTYVNDTPFFANFLLKDLERVEVLRGPQGTLYGSGSLGGTIRYITRAPQLGEFEGTVAATGSQVNGSDGIGWGADLTLNIPIGETMALRVTGSRLDYPGVTDYVNLYVLDGNGVPVAPNGLASPTALYTSKKDADFVDIWFGRASLLWKPSESFDATLTFATQSDEIGGRRQQTRGFDGFGRRYQENENGSIQLEPSNRDAQITALEANLDLGFATLTSSSSVYDHTGGSTSENTGFYAKAGFLAFYYNYPRPMASAVRTYTDEAFIQELRLVSNGDGPIDYVVGLYYQNQDRASTQDSYLRGFKTWWDSVVCAGFPACTAAVLGDRDFLYRYKENFEDRAVFGELTYHLTDTFQMTGGLRYFSNESTNDTLIDVPVYASFTNPTARTFTTEEDKVLYKVNASWNFNEDSMIYATIAEGYRRGGANAIPTSGQYAERADWLNYNSDMVTNYELGVKGLTSSGIQYTVSLFHMAWDNAQINTATPAWGFFAVYNAGKAKATGLEVALDGRIGEGFHYNLGYTYVDATLDGDFYVPSSIFALNTRTIIGRDGDRLPGTPEHSVQIAGDYTMPVGNGLDLIWRANGFYQSETENAISTSPTFNVNLPGFSIWNASVSLTEARWDVTLWVKNIFDEDGITGVYTEAYMGTAPALGYNGNGSKELISLPRTVGLSAAYHF